MLLNVVSLIKWKAATFVITLDLVAGCLPGAELGRRGEYQRASDCTPLRIKVGIYLAQ